MSLSTLPVFARWGVLIALSVLFAALLTWARLPAALLLGAMSAGILVENGGAGILVPQLPFSFAQAVVGCMIARVLTSTILHFFLHQSAGHRCQLRVGLDHQQVAHFARDDGHLGIIAWCGARHDGDGRCLPRS